MKNKKMDNVVMRKIGLSLFAVGSTLMGATAAVAADPFSFQLGVASEYTGKGLGKSDEQPSVSGQVTWTQGGAYASLFGATADLPQGSDAEILTTIGYRTTVSGYGLDLSVINRDLPGTRSGIDANYTEFQADASRTFGPVATRLRVNYTDDGFAGTKEAWWVELQGGVAINAATKATAAIADRTARNGNDYRAWNVGVKRKLDDRFAVDLRWYDTDQHDFGESYEGRLVAALTLSL